MYNLYRASHVLFREEKILEDAKKFSSKFLRVKQASNKLLDKWIISKDLPGEVRTRFSFLCFLCFDDNLTCFVKNGFFGLVTILLACLRVNEILNCGYRLV